MGNNFELSLKESTGPLLQKIINVCYQKTIHWISFNFIAFATDAYRCLHINFLSNLISFKVTKNFVLI